MNSEDDTKPNEEKKDEEMKEEANMAKEPKFKAKPTKAVLREILTVSSRYTFGPHLKGHLKFSSTTFLLTF